jgi:hypothetical protein
VGGPGSSRARRRSQGAMLSSEAPAMKRSQLS